jgi:hypothetical protein
VELEAIYRRCFFFWNIRHHSCLCAILIHPAGVYAEAAVMLGPSLHTYKKDVQKKKASQPHGRATHNTCLGRVWLANDRLCRRGILQLGKPVRYANIFSTFAVTTSDLSTACMAISCQVTFPFVSLEHRKPAFRYMRRGAHSLATHSTSRLDRYYLGTYLEYLVDFKKIRTAKIPTHANFTKKKTDISTGSCPKIA